MRYVATVLGGLFLALGLIFFVGGISLALLGGTHYYWIAGALLGLSGGLILCRSKWGVYIYGGLYVGTVIWALAEVGLAFWPLVPRVVAPTVLAIILLLLKGILCNPPRQVLRRATMTMAVLLTGSLIAVGAASFYPKGATFADAPDHGNAEGNLAAGNSNAGQKFAPFNQINVQNVSRLEVAWTMRSGDVVAGSASDQNTPLQIGDTLYTCSPNNIVHAVDVDSGKILWRYDPRVRSLLWQRCRGLGHHISAVTQGRNLPPDVCSNRIILSTIDARLIQIDANTGRPCPTFGTGGTVDLKQGMGEIKPEYYRVTSAPTVAAGVIIVGGMILDNLEVGEPSGVVRAFDVETGRLRWAWDIGPALDAPSRLQGDRYARGTPNVWGAPSVDEKLGLVYLPTGNPTPDHWGAARTPQSEKYGSALVAVDLKSGKTRWVFQITHHDLWDYDVGSQPILYDLPNGRGGVTPVVVQLNKRGEIFMLDRRTGIPVSRVEERPVPQGGMPGEPLARTQPFSVDMPSLGTETLREKDMWGMTPLDLLWCRIEFKKLRYEGPMTPPNLNPSLIFPGVFGGMNWGGGSIDPRSGYLIVNDIRLAHKIVILPRTEVDRPDAMQLAAKRYGGDPETVGHGGLQPQKGAPYGAYFTTFASPLGVPCIAPPYGELTAIDLKTRRIVWRVPLGTTRDIGPLRREAGGGFPIGLPAPSGPMSTAGGLTFFSGTQDFYLRAFETATGREVWKARLPVGSDATPMTYISPRTGRQYVIVKAGGSRESPRKGDFTIAFALPQHQFREK
ncbi:membrane-bound PQQ-dependent dehydrogenase, glucose/quinate/shikimate family [Sphingobium chlorophenolicum L-1]|uniref:Membrane-bound PQQ-dependent dehydrogenase, glucose/quinate/shikimate family n=1 Tax=Sphingobium chlorophenolicum L-1 TaxID=690566 RepID=F6F374_SPHCR|nr:membrane-bound PQQ-dependent dehydrogenase, glucose/quinate/shikimate family [Sphingobium chlorophenolicum]AEG50886.1 membrane-bound PQQ-dependent dehydrogenase, glucose/quinate/shikimate family [Sphingobium chlorophenolicum L-1]